ncbi:MAG: glutamate racemase [Erysipelotrichaceae bacterium]
MSKIGIIDSGLGGAMVLQRLRLAKPNHHYIYLADQKNAPYGEKTAEEIVALANALVATLVAYRVDCIVVACNTICANALPQLRTRYPEVHFISMIEPTVAQLNQKNKRVLVLATPATIASRAYANAIHQLDLDITVVSLAAKALVPLIEAQAPRQIVEQALAEIFATVDLAGFDAMILGCTHYPLVADLIAQQFSGLLLDSNAVTIAQLDYPESQAQLDVYTSLEPEHLQAQVIALLKETWSIKPFELMV